jgi:predicted phage baseplate assembly protein
VAAGGVLDAASHSASLDSAPAWGRELWAPVQLYGNVMPATRGESVRGEQLGVGDASLPLQSFRLKKKPLTYLPAANAAGRRSTLVVHVGGVQWQEVESFYGVDDHATVYRVRHDDEGQTDVEFGGGARLPTGAVVVADYRFGAGAALPPADSVKQVARPVAGLRRIRNVLPAYGGADAEGPAELALRGPQSALLLGRAISLVDLETAAAQQPGVRAARAAWRWDALGLGPAVIVSYIGDAQLAPAILAALRALAEDGAPISAQHAVPQPARLDVEVEIDPLQVPQDVVAAVARALFAEVTLPGTGGLLRPERLGPDGVVFSSVVVHAVMQVPGVAALRALGFDGTPFTETGRTPAAGAYFDFESLGVWVNGQRA